MKILSIIIPHHKEAIDKVDALFSSLNSQVGVDWNKIEIIVCNDTEEEFILDFSRYIKIHKSIKNLITPIKNNPGLSRQYGVDNSTGKYIMFCDIDDCLYSSLTIQESLMMINNQNDGDVYKFVVLCQNPNKYNEFIPNIKNIWVYGKIYLRRYLIKNNIRFSDKLLYSEDAYYTLMIDAFNGKQYQTQTPIYIQLANQNSITRKNNKEYEYKNSIIDHINSMDCAIEYVINNNIKKLEDLEKDISHMLYFYYSKYLAIYTIDKYKEYRIQVEKRLSDFVNKYDKDLNKLKSTLDINLLNTKLLEEGIDPRFIQKDIFKFYEEL